MTRVPPPGLGWSRVAWPRPSSFSAAAALAALEDATRTGQFGARRSRAFQTVLVWVYGKTNRTPPSSFFFFFFSWVGVPPTKEMQAVLGLPDFAWRLAHRPRFLVLLDGLVFIFPFNHLSKANRPWTFWFSYLLYFGSQTNLFPCWCSVGNDPQLWE